MKIAALGGAGKVIEGAIQDFIENDSVEEILLADINLEALEKRKNSLNSEKIVIKQVNINEHESLVRLLDNYDVCLNGSSHHFNIKVMKACIDSRTHYTDFGGLFHWAKEQLKFHEDFKKSGITGILGSGSAPGIVNVMAKYAYDRLDTVESVHIRDGIVNFNLKEYDFNPPYAIETLIDEFMMNPYEFRNGQFLEKTPFSGQEEIQFPEPIGTQTVMNTIHSEVATIPISFKDKGIKDVTFKLALPKLFEEKLRFLVELGFGEKEEVEVNGKKIIPRQVLAELVKLKNTQIQSPEEHRDFKALRVEVEGTKNLKNIKYVLDTVISPYEKWPHLSQGVFSVGFPAAVTARILGDGIIKEKGFFASEQVIPTNHYFKELAKRGIRVEVKCIKDVVENKEYVFN